MSYLPRRLSLKLRDAELFGATIIAAPSGYGKTTAVRQLEKELTHADFSGAPLSGKISRMAGAAFTSR